MHPIVSNRPQIGRRTVLSGVAGALALAASGCSTLGLFNQFTPKDKGVRLAQRALSFGPHPRQSLDLYLPDAPVARPIPLIVFFYGGGWDSGRKEDYAWAAHALASLGYAVAVPDYRLVPDVHFPAFIEDSAAAIAALQNKADQWGLAPRRVALIGHSAGGYNAMMTGLNTRYLEQAGGDPTGIRAIIGLAGAYSFLPLVHPGAIAAMGKWPVPEETQPATFARADAPKVMVIWSEADTVIEPRNVRELKAAITAVGGSLSEIHYPGLSHQDLVAALSVPFRKKAPMRADIQTFLTRYL